jgi:hypothetical protein
VFNFELELEKQEETQLSEIELAEREPIEMLVDEIT